MQKLPEVPDRKKGWRMRKEKRQPHDKEEQAFFLFQAVTSELITSFVHFAVHARIQNIYRDKKHEKSPTIIALKTLEQASLPFFSLFRRILDTNSQENSGCQKPSEKIIVLSNNYGEFSKSGHYS